MSADGAAWEGVDDLLDRLLRIPSPTGSEQEFGRFLAAHLRRIGFQVQEQPVAEGRFNLLALTGEAPVLLLSTHVDVVDPPLPVERRGPVMYGRGACDAKGALAAMVVAAQRLLAEGRRQFGLLFVVGEERDSAGARKAAGLKLGSRFVILGEPTEGALAIAQKGTLVFRLEAEGVAGHSAYPQRGRSAVHLLAKVMTQWLETDWGSDPRLGDNTLNFGTLQGGLGTNVIAPAASTEGIFRVATSLEDLQRRIRRVSRDDCRLEVLSSSEPLELGRAEGFREEVVAFGSDAPYLQALGTVYLLGPGSIAHAHTPEEQVTVGELNEAVESYYQLGIQLMQRG